MACEETALGWQDEHSLYVHPGLVDSLPTALRTFIACAEFLYGNLREADILKIHKHSGKVTFLSYAEFEAALVPKLKLRTKVNLRTQGMGVFPIDVEACGNDFLVFSGLQVGAGWIWRCGAIHLTKILEYAAIHRSWVVERS